MDFFTVDSMSMKTADILSRYYTNLNKYQEELARQNEPEIDPDPLVLEDGKSFKPTYKRHKIFDPVKKKNILVPNQRLYDPKWLLKKSNEIHEAQNAASPSYEPEDFPYGNWDGQARIVTVINIVSVINIVIIIVSVIIIIYPASSSCIASSIWDEVWTKSKNNS